MLVDLIGCSAGLLTAICDVPQICKTLKTKHADDISRRMFIMAFLSVVRYEIDAELLGLWPVVVINGIVGVRVAFEFVLKIAFARNRGEVAAAGSQECPPRLARIAGKSLCWTTQLAT